MIKDARIEVADKHLQLCRHDGATQDVYEWKEHDKKLHCCDNAGQAGANQLRK